MRKSTTSTSLNKNNEAVFAVWPQTNPKNWFFTEVAVGFFFFAENQDFWQRRLDDSLAPSLPMKAFPSCSTSCNKTLTTELMEKSWIDVENSQGQEKMIE